jgi:hypothetical protein
VDAIDSAHDILKGSRWAQEYPILMGGIEEWDFGRNGVFAASSTSRIRRASRSNLSHSRRHVSARCTPMAGAPSSAEPRASSCADLNIKVRVFAGRSTELRSAHVAISLFSVPEHHRQGIHFIHGKAQFARAKMSKRSLFRFIGATGVSPIGVRPLVATQFLD